MDGTIILKRINVNNVYITVRNVKTTRLNAQNVIHLKEEGTTLPTVPVI